MPHSHAAMPVSQTAAQKTAEEVVAARCRDALLCRQKEEGIE